MFYSWYTSQKVDGLRTFTNFYPIRFYTAQIFVRASGLSSMWTTIFSHRGHRVADMLSCLRVTADGAINLFTSCCWAPSARCTYFCLSILRRERAYRVSLTFLSPSFHLFPMCGGVWSLYVRYIVCQFVTIRLVNINFCMMFLYLIYIDG